MATTTEPGDRRTASTGFQGVGDQLEALDHRFVGHEDDAVMMQLKEVVREHLTRRPPGEPHDEDEREELP